MGYFDPTTGKASEYDLPKSTDKPYAIVAGPDGKLWFTVGQVNEFQPTSGSVWNINPTSHAFATFATQAVPVAITVGPDLNIWFNDVGLFQEGGSSRVDTRAGEIIPKTGAIAEYPGGGAGDIVSGPFGSLWYPAPQQEGKQIGAIDPTSHVTSVYDVPNIGEIGGAMAAGPGNSLWFSASGGYLVSATVVPANQSSIAGYIYLDPTGTGTQADGILSAQTVFLDLKGDGTLDPGDPIANADAFGYYTFNGLTPGTYTVRLVPYPDNIATYPAGGGQTVTVSGGQLGSPGQIGMLTASPLIPLTYDPTPFGTANPDVQTAEVNGLYRLILNRAPDASGGAAAVTYLKDGGSLTQLATDLLTSTEYDTDAVDAFYQTFLRRAPDPAGGAAALAYLQSGGSLDGLAESLMDSAEYNALFPSDASFVQAIYGDILGRLSSTTEIAAGVAFLNSGVSRPQYVSLILASAESRTRIILGEYGIIFARMVDFEGQAAAESALLTGVSPLALAISLFGSAEFTSRANATVS